MSRRQTRSRHVPLEGAAAPAFPLMYQQTALNVALSANAGIKLGTTPLELSGAAAAGGSISLSALSGTLANTNIPLQVICQVAGAPGTAMMDVSVDGGASAAFKNVPTGSSYNIPGTNIVIGFSGTFVAGQRWVPTAEQWVSQDANAFVLTTTSTATQPALITLSPGRNALWFDGSNDFLRVTQASPNPAAGISGNDLPCSTYGHAQYSNLTLFAPVFEMCSSTTSTARLDLIINTGPVWSFSKGGDTGAAVTQSGGVPAVDTQYIYDCEQTGTHCSVFINGSTIVNNGAQDTVTASTANTLVFGATSLGNSLANFAAVKISEFLSYTADNHATDGAAIVATMTARNPQPADTLPADGKFAFAGTVSTAKMPLGTSVTAIYPNKWKWRDAIFETLSFNPPVGGGTYLVGIIPGAPQSSVYFDTCGVFFDGVYSQTLGTSSEFPGGTPTVPVDPILIKSYKTLVVPPGVGLVEIEGHAQVVEILGAPGTANPTLNNAPAAGSNKLIIVRGDSSPVGYGIQRSQCWATRLRRTLPAGYHVRILGVSGAIGGQYNVAATRTAELARVAAYSSGYSGRVIWIGQYTNNDWAQNVDETVMRSGFNALFQALFSANSNNRMIGIGAIGAVSEAALNAGGKVIQTYRTAYSNAVADANAVNAGSCAYVDGSVAVPYDTGTSSPDFCADHLHMSASGHEKLRAAVQTQILLM